MTNTDFYGPINEQDSSVIPKEKPGKKKGVGIDALPEYIKSSKFLSGNELAKLGGLESLPQNIVFEDLDAESQQKFRETDKDLLCLVKEALDDGSIIEAFKMLILSKDNI